MGLVGVLSPPFPQPNKSRTMVTPNTAFRLNIEHPPLVWSRRIGRRASRQTRLHVACRLPLVPPKGGVVFSGWPDARATHNLVWREGDYINLRAQVEWNIGAMVD